MTELEKAARQALEALEEGKILQRDRAITALRTAIEQAEKQEPVALKYQLVKIHDALGAHLGDTDPYIPEDMTDEEVCEYEPVFWAAKEIADLIGDAPWSNYTTPPAAPVQEPTVTVRYDLSPAMTESAIRDKLIELGWTPPAAPVQEHDHIRDATKMVAAQRQWVGLTGQQKNLIARISIDVFDAIHRTEAKLREKNGGQA